MRYAQVHKKQKLHLVYELPNGDVTQPVCGKKADNFRMTINMPLGNACKNCLRRLNSKAYNENEFLRTYFE